MSDLPKPEPEDESGRTTRPNTVVTAQATAPRSTGRDRVRSGTYGDMALQYPLFLPWTWFLLPDDHRSGGGTAVTAAARTPEAVTAPPVAPSRVTDPAPEPESESESPPVAAPTAEPATGADAPAALGPNLAAVDNLIKDYVIVSMTLGLVPLPLVDVAAMIGVQVKMAHSLSKRYGVPFSEHRAQAIATSLAGSLLPVSAGLGVASLFKVVPGVGSLVGGATAAILSGAVTYATGRLLAQHFESGGTLLTFDPTQVRPTLRAEFRTGRKLAARLHRQGKVPGAGAHGAVPARHG